MEIAKLIITFRQGGNMEYLTGEDWAQFAMEFPDAANWIMRRGLYQECIYLQNKTKRNKWEAKRLIELCTLMWNLSE